MNDINKKLWKKAERYARFLNMIPFVRMVAVCNNLAFGKVDEQSDIDLFVVAKTGRLFTVRIFITALLHVLGVRRHGDKISGRFCLSFFVDDSYLNLSKIAIENDIYLAFWVKNIVPIIDDGVSDEFLKANVWARGYFENSSDFEIDNSRILKRYSFLRGFLKWILSGWFGNVFEKWMKNWQLRRAGRKSLVATDKASLLVAEHVLKFHNVDRRREYRGLWLEKYGEDVKLSREKFLTI